MNLFAHWVPAREVPRYYPLRSYLRMPPASVAAEYISALTRPGDLVVDPFASTPTIPRTAHRLGRRAIAVESNPLWSWLAHAMATLPSENAINAALTQLGDALKDGIPLRTHISRMYETVCAACHNATPADCFIYARGLGPVRRQYTCVSCGETRDESATEDDLKRSAVFEERGFHYHFAFERVVPADNLHAERIRKMLDLYTPRNLEALVTLTVKIDSLFRSSPEHEVLSVLLLHLLDRGSSFYLEPSPEANAQVASHKQFVEFNLWQELERAAILLGKQTDVPIEELASNTGIVMESETPRVFLGRGSARSLTRALPGESAALVLAAPPIRRVGVWALSYFWGAWVLGRAAVEHLVAALDPHAGEPYWERRWYLEMLTGAFDGLSQLLKTDAPAVFVFEEAWQEVIEALLLAASGARLELESFLFQPRWGDMPRREFDNIPGGFRIAFGKRKMTPMTILAEASLAEKVRSSALAACREILTRRGQPLAYSWIHYAAYSRAAFEQLLMQVMSANPKITPSRFCFYAIREGLNEGYAHELDHYSNSTQFLWLRHAQVNTPLFDRVDDAVFQILSTRRLVPALELEDQINRQFPGDLTPEAGLVELCATAYADEQNGAWHYVDCDQQVERGRALEALNALGTRLEYRVGQAAPFDLVWEAEGETVHGFVWRSRGRWDDLAQMQISPARGYLVVPERQTGLTRARADTLPLHLEAFRDAGWDFVRVPFVDKLLGEEKIDRHDITLITGLVPAVAAERTQLELF